MENRNVGLLIIGIAVVMAIIVFLFNSVLKENLGLVCSHGPSCEMYTNLNVQTWISLSIVAVVFIIGLVIMFNKPKEKIIVKTIREKKKKLNLEGLENDERKVIDLLLAENGTMFQASLMEKMEIGKVGMTRLLDKLEAKQLIERKRRGMNNVVVLKD
ncbi:MAG: MarR family transcriptional regulator [archaeon]|nr:MarR family transcriptional regulator [archaeon]